MTNEQAIEFVSSRIVTTREDIARAKSWLIRFSQGNTDNVLGEWLLSQQQNTPNTIDVSSSGLEESFSDLARAFSLRMAYYQAVAELIGEGILFVRQGFKLWEPTVQFWTPGYRGSLEFKDIICSYPEWFVRSRIVQEPILDCDLFLQGVDCKSLHSGILEAIDQSLGCFRRGLYMPAIAMLAAAVEATWHECAEAVGRNLSDMKLGNLVNDPHTGIGKLVSETVLLLSHGNTRPLLQKAGRSVSQVRDAELWTTILRDHRNALHWGKAKSFIADHSTAGTLLLAAPVHIKTLESIRVSC